MTTLRRLTAWAFLSLALAACAGSPEGEPAEPTVQIRVVNELVPTTALTVHLVDAGERAMLGTVVPSGQRTFVHHMGEIGEGSFRLIAETGTGREITSEPFTLRADAAVEWDVQANTVEPR